MAPISVTLFAFGFLCVVQAADIETNVPHSSSGSLKDIGFPPSSNWTVPQGFDVISTFINKTSSNVFKPLSGGQIGVNNNTSNDPVALQVPVAYKPENPNLINQVLSNAPGLNNSFGLLTNFTKPGEKPPTTANDPVQGFVDSSQVTLSNTSSAVQGVAGQWGTNVQAALGNFLGASSNRPSNDQAVSGSTSAPANPIQSFLGNSQAAWSNATGAAQGVAGQLGSNVQNGISNVFGINLNLPSNDEPAGSSNSSTTDSDQQPSTPATQSSTASTASESSTTSLASTTPASTTSGPFFNVLGTLGNNSQTSLFNTSALVQTLTNPLSSNVQGGPFGFLFANLNRPGAAPPATNGTVVEKPQKASADTPLADAPPAPTAPTCTACSSAQCSYSPWQNLRIIGGANVPSTTTYPWIALITYLQSPNGQGALINDRTILTTATIVYSMPTVAQIGAFVGLYNLSSAVSGMALAINTTYMHPAFVPANLYANNIGLLILQTPLSSFVPVCMPMPSQQLFGIARATVIGWGSTTGSAGSLSNTLQAVQLQMYATLACQVPNPQIANNNLCGGLIVPSGIIQATCTGDGGDPLVVQPAGSTAWQIIGVALDIPGYGCGMAAQPSVFTNVVAYADWIATYGPGCNCPQ